eukprot:XP_014062799.1 PREDICTED: uncharacterized protein LOC106609002 isoform X2 [Salmo salar]
MSKLQSFRVFLNERLTEAAMEIFGAVEKAVVEYQEENDRLRRMLLITPEIKLCGIETRQGFLFPVENVNRKRIIGMEYTQPLGSQLKAPCSSLLLSLKRRFPLSSSTVSRSGATVWGRRTQSPHRLKWNRRNSGPVRRKSIFKGWSLIS